MLDQQGKLWDYDAVEPGQTGPTTEVEITRENIAQFALLAQNPDPRFQRPGVNREYGGAMLAMPTMVITYAPLLREDIAEANGFVAQERSTTARHQTPFAKCEIRWWGPVHAGDAITGSRRVLEKYDRRGSKFVTFRVEAANQHGEKVAEYDYTCIFGYAQGSKAVPQDRGSAQPAPLTENPEAQSPPSSSFLTFDTLSVGDQLAALSISESQEVINRKSDFRLSGAPNPVNIHNNEEFARQNIFSGTVASGPAAMTYLDQMLQKSFPLRAFYQGGQLLMRAIEPFRAGDTVTFQGEVTAKRVESADPSVECRIKGINQRGDLVNLSDAKLILPE
jgi:acyl dehydratase